MRTLFYASAQLNGMKKWAVHPKYVKRANRYRELYQIDKQLLVDGDHRGISGCESLCGNINGARRFFFWRSYTSVCAKALQASIISAQITRGTQGNNMLWTSTRKAEGGSLNLSRGVSVKCMPRYKAHYHVLPAFFSFIKNKSCKTEETINRPTTETRPAEVISHKSSLAIMTIQFYIQISKSNKILMRIQ